VESYSGGLSYLMFSFHLVQSTESYSGGLSYLMFSFHLVQSTESYSGGLSYLMFSFHLVQSTESFRFLIKCVIPILIYSHSFNVFHSVYFVNEKFSLPLLNWYFYVYYLRFYATHVYLTHFGNL